MKTKILSLVMTIAILFTVMAFIVPASAEDTSWDGSVAVAFAGGDGTQANPYQISNGAELAYLASIVNGGNAGVVAPYETYYILTADIDLGNREWKGIGELNDATKGFKGKFNGNGKTISGFLQAADKTWGSGLFGMVFGGTIENLTLIGRVTSKALAGSSSGFLTTALNNNSVVKNCKVYVDVTITHASAVEFGAISGKAGTGAKIENCTVYGSMTFNVTVSATNGQRQYTAGIAARGEASNITGCANYANISHIFTGSGTIAYSGGIMAVSGIGEGIVINITDCANYGNIYTITNGGHARAGGIIGNAGQGGAKGTFNITNCFNQGNITVGAGTGSNYIGGLTGLNEVAAPGGVKYTNCYVSGSAYSGNGGTTSTYTDCSANVKVLNIAGAAVRIDDPTGLRFDAEITKTLYNFLNDSAGVTVTIGTVIAPASYVSAAGEFTMAALDKYKSDMGYSHDTYRNIVFNTESYEFLEETASTFVFSGAIADIYETNYNLEYSAVGYLTISVGNSSVTFYSAYTKADNSRTVSAVANAAYADRNATATAEYAYVTADGDYSPYNAAVLAKIKVFADAHID